MRIGSRVFDPKTGEVHHGDQVVRLEPQPAAALALLASRPGELVSHDELRRAIWGDDTHVDVRQGLHYGIRRIRQALGDTDRESPLVETVPRRGYRLRAPVAAGEGGRGTAAPFRAGRVRWPVWAVLTAAALASVAVVERRPNNHHQVAVAVLQAVHDFVY